jgi:hypothetical protein
VSGSHLPSKRPTLFGLLVDHTFLGIFYRGDDGKAAAILLEAEANKRTNQLERVLEALTGKPAESAR